jgi:hypothetical protein
MVELAKQKNERALAKLAYSPWLRTLSFYSSGELASMLRRAGFQIVEVERVDRSEHTAYTHQLAYAVK